MNLIDDLWIPVVREDRKQYKIAPYQIVETDNPVIEISAPRPDFQGALYQFLIGLLQTVYAPEDQEKWLERWQQTPPVDELKEAFSKVSEAFELTNPDGAAFMQDLDLNGAESKNISGLLIEAPGGKTLKDNLDHFVKGGQVNKICESCAATALFSLQINAPSGGVGHRVSLRGGGPLTTLLKMSNHTGLWQNLWLNVMSKEEVDGTTSFDNSIFPWLAETRYSQKGEQTHPADVNELQMYWSMPRRIRLNFDEDEHSICDLCGSETSVSVCSYATKNYGTNYDGPWVHNLTPYKFDPKKEKIPLSIKGQQGGLGYRHWLTLVWQDDDNGDRSARVVRSFNEEKSSDLDNEQMGLWCFGFDMDNMKARCWYEHQLPLLKIPKQQREPFIAFVCELLRVAKEAVKELRSHIKMAWFSRPKDAKGDMTLIDQSFWEATEQVFYQQLHNLSDISELRHFPPQVAKEWFYLVRGTSMMVFDEWVLESCAEDLNMKRITAARRSLEKKLNNGKIFKNLKEKIKEREIV